jgi:hypothetical protein
MAVFTDVQFTSEVTMQALALSVDVVMSSEPKGIMLLCTQEAGDWGNEFNTWLKTLGVPVFGGIFPGLLLDAQFEPKGILVAGLASAIAVSIIENISHCVPQSVSIAPPSAQTHSVVIMVDAMSRQVDGHLQNVLLSLPDNCCVFGGGAGTLAFASKPCLFSSQGMHQDAMLLIHMSTQWDLAVGHGWEVLAGPYLANKVDDNCILELNFEPATGLYRRVLEEHSEQCFADKDFFDIAKTFPFGVARLDDSVLIRDPIKEDRGGVICAGDVPENTMLYIMSGEADKLITAASGAVERTLTVNGSLRKVTDSLLFDCVSRQLFLEDKFPIELSEIHAQLTQPFRAVGALVLGEIALDETGVLSLHNKTAVTALARARNTTA